MFTSDKFNAFQLVSILRCCDMLVSSRYHAVVTSMGGLVPSAGVTMDGRIRNLMDERGHAHLVVDAADSQLEPKLLEVLDRLTKEREAIADAIGRTVVKNLKAMAQMGVYLEEEVRLRHPNFSGLGGKRSWEEYLPALGPNLCSLVEKYESGNGVARPAN